MSNLTLLLLTFAAYIVSSECSACDHQFRKSCYEFSKNKVSNRYAQDACRGGKLADGRSSRVVDYLSNMLKERNLNAAWVEGSPAFSTDSPCPFKLNKNGESEFDWVDDIDDCKDGQKLYAICEFDVRAAPTKKCKVHDSIIENGFLIPCTKKKAVDPGTRLAVECWTGYKLRGPEEITCKDNGKWTKRPVCAPVCAASLLQGDGITVLPLTEEADAQEKKYYKVKESAVIICENGIIGNSTFPVTHKIVTCLGSNRWSEIFPHCIPFDKITFSYPMRAQNVITADDHSSLTLECPSDVDGARKLWTKEQQQLSLGKKFSVSDDGTLSIPDFTEGDEGRYLCIIQTPDSKFHFVSYDLRLYNKEAYFYYDSLEVIKLNEGKSKVLLCKESSYISRQKWYKNGIPFYGTVLGSSITDDGALYLSNVSPLDNGLYLCVVERPVQGGGVALIVASYQIKVIPTAKTACGQLFYSTDSTGIVQDDDEDEEEEGITSYEEHVPWFVSLYKGDKAPFCYGSLIGVRWVLTSAQCFKNVNRNDGSLIVSVGFDSVDKKDDEYEKIRNNEEIIVHFVQQQNFTVPVQSIDNQSHFFIPTEILEEVKEMPLTLEVDPQEKKDYYIEEIIIHPEYDGKFLNDLALVRLEEEVPVTDIVRTICLPHLLRFTDDVNCEEARIRDGVVTTRGRLELLDRDMKTRGKEVQIHRRQRCNKLFEAQLPPTVICVEDPTDFENETKLFKGDLGSPLEVMWLNRATVWGIYTGTKGRYFEFYTEVLPYLDWIKETMKGK